MITKLIMLQRIKETLKSYEIERKAKAARWVKDFSLRSIKWLTSVGTNEDMSDIKH